MFIFFTAKAVTTGARNCLELLFVDGVVGGVLTPNMLIISRLKPFLRDMRNCLKVVC